jgi:hypothetical protein
MILLNASLKALSDSYPTAFAISRDARLSGLKKVASNLYSPIGQIIHWRDTDLLPEVQGKSRSRKSGHFRERV